MNYKGVQFRTVFVSGINIEKTSKSLGVLPTGVKPNGAPHYTLPAILDRTNPTSPVAFSDSVPILNYLEKTYPTPGRVLFPAGRETRGLYQPLILKIIYFMPYLAAGAHLAAKVDEDRDEFRGRLERLFGKPVEEIEKQGAERDAAYDELEGVFEQLGNALEGEDSFLLTGERMIAADFAVAGCIMFIKCLSPEDVYAKLRSWHGGRWARFFDAFEPYMALNNP